MAKRKRSVAPYVALLIAVLIFVPAVRELFVDLFGPLLDVLKDFDPFRA